MQLKVIHTIALTLITFLLAPLAFAHSGLHGSHGLIDGFMHPATGLDHLLAAIAAGYWAARDGNHGVRDVVFFLTLLASGILLGMLSLAMPQLPVAGMLPILLTVVVIAIAIGHSAWLLHALFGSVASYHGLTHMLGMPAGTSQGGFGLGLLLSTAVLVIFGLILRQVIVTRRPHAGA